MTHTFAEYLEMEEVALERHEYLDGEIFEIPPGGLARAALGTALTVRVVGLEGPCRTYGPGLRIRVRATGLATYATVTIVCGAPQLDPESPTHVVNPTVIFHVGHDRGWREHFFQIDTLREYFVLAQDRRLAERWSRDGQGGWTHEVIGADGTLMVDSIGGSFPLADLYRSAGL